jgi:pentatricopeptide repeat protein
LQYELASYVWKKRVQTHYQHPPTGVFLNVLTAAARHGDIGLATDVFGELGNREVIFEYQHYEMLVEAYVNAGDVVTSLSVLCVMQDSRMPPTDHTTRSIFKYVIKDTDRPKELYEELRSLHHDGKSVPIAAVNCLIEAAVYHQDIELAIEFYKVLHEICPDGANTETFNKLLRGCSHSNPPRKDIALILASELLALGLKPDRITYDRMLLICTTHDGDYGDALRYYQEMRTQMLEPRVGTMIALVKRLTLEVDERVFGLVIQMDSMDLRTNVSRVKRWIRMNWTGDPRWTAGDFGDIRPDSATPVE